MVKFFIILITTDLKVVKASNGRTMYFKAGTIIFVYNYQSYTLSNKKHNKQHYFLCNTKSVIT